MNPHMPIRAMYRRAAQYCLIACSSLSMAACGMLDSYVTIQPSPGTVGKKAEQTGVSVALQVADSRDRKDVVGSWCGFRDCRSRNDIASLVKHALSTELALIGYQVGENGVGVSVNITKFYNYACTDITETSEVEFDVKVLGETDALYEGKQYGAHRRKKNFWRLNPFHTAGDVEDNLQAALSRAIAKLMKDDTFHEAISRGFREQGLEQRN